MIEGLAVVVDAPLHDDELNQLFAESFYRSVGFRTTSAGGCAHFPRRQLELGKTDDVSLQFSNEERTSGDGIEILLRALARKPCTFGQTALVGDLAPACCRKSRRLRGLPPCRGFS